MIKNDFSGYKEVTLSGSYLYSRSEARRVRSDVEELLNRGTPVCFDLSGVLSVSDSYADELFGVLAAKHGLDCLLDRVRLRTSDENVAASIAAVIKRRSEKSAEIA